MQNENAGISNGLTKKILLLLMLSGVAHAATGIAAVVANYDFYVSNSSPMPVTPIYVADQTAFYRLSGSMSLTNQSLAGTICYNIFWTDGDTGLSTSVGPICPAGATLNTASCVRPFYAMKGTAISINNAFTNLTGVVNYNVHMRLEQF